MFQPIKSWPVLILGPKVTPPGHVSTQVAQLNTHTQHSEESSVKLGDMRHCLSLVNEKSFPSGFGRHHQHNQDHWRKSFLHCLILLISRDSKFGE